MRFLGIADFYAIKFAGCMQTFVTDCSSKETPRIDQHPRDSLCFNLEVSVE